MTEMQKYDKQGAMRTIWHARKSGQNWDTIQDTVATDHGVVIPTNDLAVMYRAYMLQLLDTYGADSREQDLAMELERLNDIQAAFWPAALAGDEKAATVVMNIMKIRHRITGMDALDPSDTTIQQRVLIIGDNKDDWIAALAQGKANRPVLAGPVRDDSEDTKEV